MNLLIHAQTLKVRRKLVRSRSSSNLSGSGLVCARLSTSLMTLASTSDAGDDRVTGLIGPRTCPGATPVPVAKVLSELERLCSLGLRGFHP